jgi:predicted nucleic acid-binding protein
MMPAKVTLDTNVVLEYLKNQQRASTVRRLLDMVATGDIDLAVTARIRDDVPRPPLADRLNDLAVLGIREEPSVTRLGSWVLGRDVLGSENFVGVSETATVELSADGTTPPDWRDWDHLHAHYLRKRDVFLTWDRRILDLAPRLRTEVGLSIMSPEDYLDSRGAA